MKNNRKSNERDSRPHEFTAKDAINTTFPIIAAGTILLKFLIHIAGQQSKVADQMTTPLIIICAGAVIANALWEDEPTPSGRHKYMKISYVIAADLRVHRHRVPTLSSSISSYDPNGPDGRSARNGRHKIRAHPPDTHNQKPHQ